MSLKRRERIVRQVLQIVDFASPPHFLQLADEIARRTSALLTIRASSLSLPRLAVPVNRPLPTRNRLIFLGRGDAATP